MSTAQARPTPSLRLLPASTPAPLPRGDWLLHAYARRPGDRHEVVAVPERAQFPLAELAAGAGLSTDVVAALILEAAALIRQADAAAGDGAAMRLDRVIERESRVGRPLTAAEGAYLRALTWGQRPRTRPRATETVALPVRLLSRVDEGEWPIEPAAPPLERALAWEVAALLAGRTLTEWGLEQLLRAAHGGG